MIYKVGMKYILWILEVIEWIIYLGFCRLLRFEKISKNFFNF